MGEQNRRQPQRLPPVRRCLGERYTHFIGGIYTEPFGMETVDMTELLTSDKSVSTVVLFSINTSQCLNNLIELQFILKYY